MSHYLVPSEGQFDTLTEALSRNGLDLHSPVKLKDLIVLLEGEAHGFFAVPTTHIVLLSRNAAELLTEMPSVVTSVPGLVYPREWMNFASTFPAVDWMEVEKKLSKSGSVGFTPEAAEKTSKSTMHDAVEYDPREDLDGGPQ